MPKNVDFVSEETNLIRHFSTQMPEGKFTTNLGFSLSLSNSMNVTWDGDSRRERRLSSCSPLGRKSPGTQRVKTSGTLTKQKSRSVSNLMDDAFSRSPSVFDRLYASRPLRQTRQEPADYTDKVRPVLST